MATRGPRYRTWQTAHLVKWHDLLPFTICFVAGALLQTSSSKPNRQLALRLKLTGCGAIRMFAAYDVSFDSMSQWIN